MRGSMRVTAVATATLVTIALVAAAQGFIAAAQAPPRRTAPNAPPPLDGADGVDADDVDFEML